jgi:hypothetical protein
MPFDTEIHESLRVSLSPEELVTKSQELARHLQETQDIKDRLARERKLQQEQLKEREQREQELALDVALGSEMREVACFESPRWSERLVDIVRADTHEVVRTRAMQPEERQREMFVVRDDEDEDDDPEPGRAH